MSYRSAPEDLALHGVRVLGFATASRVAARYRLDGDTVEESLLDYEALGWVGRSSFAGSSGWSITEAGRVENERRLAAELDRAGARETVVSAHGAFLSLNERLAKACTDWRWDERVLRALASVGASLDTLCAGLTERLTRFDGYAQSYTAALREVDAGGRAWVDAPDLESCHTVWIRFHEDLLATLGIPRGSDT